MKAEYYIEINEDNPVDEVCKELERLGYYQGVIENNPCQSINTHSFGAWALSVTGVQFGNEIQITLKELKKL